MLSDALVALALIARCVNHSQSTHRTRRTPSIHRTRTHFPALSSATPLAGRASARGHDHMHSLRPPHCRTAPVSCETSRSRRVRNPPNHQPPVLTHPGTPSFPFLHPHHPALKYSSSSLPRTHAGRPTRPSRFETLAPCRAACANNRTITHSHR